MNSVVNFFIALLCVLTTAGQQVTADKHDVLYQKIPEQQRELLKQNLNELVESQKVGDWKRVYALLDKQHTETEDKFINKMKRTHALHEFHPSKATFIPSDDSWNIQGCASFEGDQPGRGYVASVHARWADSHWYFSPIVTDLFGSEKKMTPRECSLTG